MSQKQHYQIRNWKDYNKALVNRGSLTLWFDQKSINYWHSKTKTRERGRPQLYSDLAIQCCLTLKVVFHLPLRATQGLVSSLLQMLGLPLKAPDYSLLSLRQKDLVLKLSATSVEPMHLVVDSTGLKLYGEGEWKVRKYGKSKRRTWLKLHLGVNEKSHTIEACVLTDDSVHDNETLPHMVEQISGKIAQITGDGAYDSHNSYAVALEHGAKPCFPPRVNARRHKATDEAWRLRNHVVSHMYYHGLADWKKKNNYHRRSLAEVMMFRFKQLLGTNIMARTVKRQAKEVGIKCLVINKMTDLGMPSYAAI